MRLSLRFFVTVFVLCCAIAPAAPAQHAFIKCATEEAFAKRQKTPLEVPNVLRDSLFSPTGKFLIHYDATASKPDSVTTIEYAEQAARLADSAYELEVTELGFKPPPFSDNGHYDILLVPLTSIGAYGATFPMFDGDLGTSPSGLPLSKCYIVVDNHFSSPIYATKGYDALRITIFHEFFHVIQFGSYGHRQQNTYFQEMSSVWMEMYSTPGVPDWLSPGPLGAGAYLGSLDLSWDRSPTGGYGQAIFLQYLDTLYTPLIVKDIWNNISTTSANPIEAVSDALEAHGTNFCTTYRDFGTEAFESGRRLAHNHVLPRAAELPVDSIPYTILDSSARSFQLLPLSINFFVRGFGADTCAVVLSRNTDRTNASGNVSMPIEGQAIVNADDPASVCDTTFCLSPPEYVVTVSPNPVTPFRPGPFYFVVSRAAQKPNSVLLDMYTVGMVPLRHDEPEAKAYGPTYRVAWDARDDSGRDVPSGEYIYSVTVDGKKAIGKVVVVR